MKKQPEMKRALVHLGSEAGKLLLEIAGQCLIFMTEGRQGPYAAGMGVEEYEAMLRAKERKRCREVLQQLKHQRLVRIRKQADMVLFILSKDGKVALLREKICQTSDQLPNQEQCLVVFDFPIEARTARDEFRYFLKEAGFVRLQQSVWLTNRNVGSYLLLFVRLMKCEQWIQIFSAQVL